MARPPCKQGERTASLGVFFLGAGRFRVRVQVRDPDTGRDHVIERTVHAADHLEAAQIRRRLRDERRADLRRVIPTRVRRLPARSRPQKSTEPAREVEDDVTWRSRLKSLGDEFLTVRRFHVPKETQQEVTRMRGDQGDFEHFVRSFLAIHRPQAALVVATEPYNPRISEPGTTVISLRMDADDGRHLVALLNFDGVDVRVSYVVKAYRGLLDAIAARLRERFG